MGGGEDLIKCGARGARWDLGSVSLLHCHSNDWWRIQSVGLPPQPYLPKVSLSALIFIGFHSIGRPFFLIFFQWWLFRLKIRVQSAHLWTAGWIFFVHCENCFEFYFIHMFSYLGTEFSKDWSASLSLDSNSSHFSFKTCVKLVKLSHYCLCWDFLIFSFSIAIGFLFDFSLFRCLNFLMRPHFFSGRRFRFSFLHCWNCTVCDCSFLMA